MDDFAALDLADAVISRFELDWSNATLSLQVTVFLAGAQPMGRRCLLLWSDVTHLTVEKSSTANPGNRLRSAQFVAPLRYVLTMNGSERIVIDAGSFAVCRV